MASNLRSARPKTLERRGSGMPSKSRKGWYTAIVSPRSAAMRRTSAGVPLYDRRSFSKISTELKPALAIACSFSSRVPLRQTVAMASSIGLKLPLDRRSREAPDSAHIRRPPLSMPIASTAIL